MPVSQELNSQSLPMTLFSYNWERKRRSRRMRFPPEAQRWLPSRLSYQASGKKSSRTASQVDSQAPISSGNEGMEVSTQLSIYNILVILTDTSCPKARWPMNSTAHNSLRCAGLPKNLCSVSLAFLHLPCRTPCWFLSFFCHSLNSVLHRLPTLKQMMEQRSAMEALYKSYNCHHVFREKKCHIYFRLWRKF